MDAAMIARVMSGIPERATWVHSGTAFASHDGQGPQVKYLAQFLQWLCPLTVLTKDDLRALGLLVTHQRPLDVQLEQEDEAGEEGELAEEGAFEEEGELAENGELAEEGELGEGGELEEEAADFDPDATLPPQAPAPDEERIDVGSI